MGPLCPMSELCCKYLFHPSFVNSSNFQFYRIFYTGPFCPTFSESLPFRPYFTTVKDPIFFYNFFFVFIRCLAGSGRVKYCARTRNSNATDEFSYVHSTFLVATQIKRSPCQERRWKGCAGRGRPVRSRCAKAKSLVTR